MVIINDILDFSKMGSEKAMLEGAASSSSEAMSRKLLTSYQPEPLRSA